MPKMPVRDTALYYERTGSGPQLLFIHGMAGQLAAADGPPSAADVLHAVRRAVCALHRGG